MAALGKEQQEAVQRCVQRIVGREGPTASDLEGQPINVLLVDDSVTIRIELGDAMRARGMRVRVADNGLAALSAALKRVPDVILTDVEMPVMDGWTLLRTVRKRAKLANVPVVFLTALSDEMSRLQGYRLGVDDYLSKDTKPEEVMARLRGALLRRARAPEDRPGAQGLRGDLEHVRLGSVLAFLESERRTGELRIKNGSDQAVLHVCRGYLEYVENLGRFAHATDRVFDLLEWNHGEFEFFNRDGSGENPSDDATPLSYLLMEHARRIDEANAG